MSVNARAHWRLMSPPALNRARSGFCSMALDGHDLDGFSLKSTVFPLDLALATGIKRLMGNFRAIKPSMMVRPTNPVAPTTARVLRAWMP